MKKVSIFSIISLLVLVTAMMGCGGSGTAPESNVETGTLAFYANGEDFVRQGFVSKDGWSITFDHVYITLSDITAYQTEPPYDATSGAVISGTNPVSLNKAYTIDLAEGGPDASPLLIDTATDIAAGHYNALSFKISRADSGTAEGYSLIMIGTAEKDGVAKDFTIKVEEVCDYQCGEYVGDERKGIVTSGATADLELTFHFDHIFGDADTPLDDGLNLGAIGFEPFAGDAAGSDVLNMAEMHLGHVGEGHCHCACE